MGGVEKASFEGVNKDLSNAGSLVLSYCTNPTLGVAPPSGASLIVPN
jgi:hypothetical protein